MPRTINPYPEQTKPTPDSLKDVRYPYKYPLGLDLRPGSDMHEFLKGEIMSRAQESRAALSNRFESWRKIDETLTSYIPLSEVEENLLAEDETKPVSMVVPLSYATIELLLSYLVLTFAEEPILRYEGFTDEDVIGAILMEKLVELQTRKSGMGIQLHTLFRDALAYGFGVAAPVWVQKMGWRRQKRQQGIFSTFLNKVTGYEDIVERVEDVRFEGNELYNIDPYNYLPDANHAIQDVQRSEYVGWLRHETRMEILGRETYDENTFNGRYLKHIDGISTLGADESKRDRHKVSSMRDGTSSFTERMDTIYMYVELIPSEWKSKGDKGPSIGRSRYPEKWAFALSGDQVIVSAHPLELDHNLFPVVVAAPDYDGYTLTPVSKMETVYGLQKLINFLYNSHVMNVRKAIHDMFVVDPKSINVNDLLSPKPGKIIRTRRQAWGRGVTGLMEQLKVVDVTSGHIRESIDVAQMLDRVSGAEDAIQGSTGGKKERVSASEFQGRKSSALNRLEKHAFIIGLQAINPLGEMYASHTQQFMSQDQYVAIVGEYEERLREEYGDAKDRIMVGPMDILVKYNVITHAGTLPTSGDPQAWLAMMQMIGGNPALAERFDVVRIFEHWARLSGAKNLHRFVRRITPSVMQDEEVADQVQKGNLITAEEAIGE